MSLDAGRRFDLEELAEMRRTAPNGFWRDKYDQQINKILRESQVIGRERENLLKAVRAGDRRSVMYYQTRIKQIEKDDTYGRVSA